MVNIFTSNVRMIVSILCTSNVLIINTVFPVTSQSLLVMVDVSTSNDLGGRHGGREADGKRIY